ncbi:MAG: outer membrane lipid asymmetry maintenance protein MlaD [Desulfovibrio sp.]
MSNFTKETAVGIFVFIGLIFISYMTVKLGDVQLFSDNFYELHAEFNDITGLRAKAPVQMYGVDVGYVSAISLNQKDGVAEVVLKLRKDVILTDDAIASVKTSGLIGDKFVKITPGGVGDELKPGDIIFETESSVDLEELISKYVFGGV